MCYSYYSFYFRGTVGSRDIRVIGGQAVGTTAEQRRRSSLIALQFGWANVYEISVRDNRWYGVLESDPTVVLEQRSAGQLQTALEQDWAERKPRTSQGAGSCSC